MRVYFSESRIGPGGSYFHGNGYLKRKWKEPVEIYVGRQLPQLRIKGHLYMEIFLDETNPEVPEVQCTIIDKDNVIKATLDAIDLEIEDGTLFAQVNLAGHQYTFGGFSFQSVPSIVVGGDSDFYRFQSDFQVIVKEVARLFQTAKQSKTTMTTWMHFDTDGPLQMAPEPEPAVSQGNHSSEQTIATQVLAIPELHDKILQFVVFGGDRETASGATVVNHLWRRQINNILSSNEIGFHLLTPETLVSNMETMPGRVPPTNGLPVVLMINNKAELDRADTLRSLQNINMNLLGLELNSDILTKKIMGLITSMLFPRLTRIKIFGINQSPATIKKLNMFLPCFPQIKRLELILDGRNLVMAQDPERNGPFINVPPQLTSFRFLAIDQNAINLIRVTPTCSFPVLRRLSFALCPSEFPAEFPDLPERQIQKILDAVAPTIRTLDINKSITDEANNVTVTLPTMLSLQLLSLSNVKVSRIENLPKLNACLIIFEDDGMIDGLFPPNTQHLNLRKLAIWPRCDLPVEKIHQIMESIPLCTTLHVVSDNITTTHKILQSAYKNLPLLQTLRLFFNSEAIQNDENELNSLQRLLTGLPQQRLLDVNGNPELWDSIQLGENSLLSLHRVERLTLTRFPNEQPTNMKLDDLLFHTIIKKMPSIKKILLFNFPHTSLDVVNSIRELGKTIEEDNEVIAHLENRLI